MTTTDGPSDHIGIVTYGWVSCHWVAKNFEYIVCHEISPNIQLHLTWSITCVLTVQGSLSRNSLWRAINLIPGSQQMFLIVLAISSGMNQRWTDILECTGLPGPEPITKLGSCSWPNRASFSTLKWPYWKLFLKSFVCNCWLCIARITLKYGKHFPCTWVLVLVTAFFMHLCIVNAHSATMLTLLIAPEIIINYWTFTEIDNNLLKISVVRNHISNVLNEALLMNTGTLSESWAVKALMVLR